MRNILLRSFLVLLLAACVPVQAALAMCSGQDAAMEKCHDGHDGHGKNFGAHCGACASAIAGAIYPVTYVPANAPLQAVPELAPSSELADGLDRPPRAP